MRALNLGIFQPYCECPWPARRAAAPRLDIDSGEGGRGQAQLSSIVKTFLPIVSILIYVKQQQSQGEC